MKIKEGFVLRNICGEYIVVAVGRQTLDFKGLIKLNETGAFLWETLQAECTADELLAAMRAEYDVDAETAQADIDTFIASLQAAELIA